jgi:putative proteasome-type protease
VDVVTSGKIALASMLSTAHANLSVGPPYDVAVYRNGTFEVKEYRLDADHPYLAEIDQAWRASLLESIGQLPPIPDDILTSLA